MTAPNHDQLLAHAEHSIAVGSKSFAAAARLFDAHTRRSAVLLYAWCRHCDDVIDGQQAGHEAVVISQEEAQVRLLDLQRQTEAACADLPVNQPAFAALRDVPPVTRDGHRVTLMVNAGLRDDAAAWTAAAARAWAARR